MPIRFTCPKCGAELNVKDKAAGRQGQCPACKNAVTVPRLTTARRQVEEVEEHEEVVEPELVDEDRPRRSVRREEDEEDDRPRRSRLGMRREKLGSLTQSARSKHLKQIRGILLAIGVLTMIVNGILFAMAPEEAKQAVEQEIRKQGVVGVNAAERQRAEEKLIQIIRLIYGGLIGVGALYVVFGLIVHQYPVAITVTALVIYVGVQIVFAAINFLFLLQGILIKAIIVVALIKGIQTAIVYQKERDAEAREEAEADLSYE